MFTQFTIKFWNKLNETLKEKPVTLELPGEGRVTLVSCEAGDHYVQFGALPSEYYEAVQASSSVYDPEQVFEISMVLQGNLEVLLSTVWDIIQNEHQQIRKVFP
jgi:hypothetical protein